MADVGNLTAKLTLDTAGFSSGVGEVNNLVGKLAGGVGSALTGVTAAVGAAVAGAATGIASLVNDSVKGFGELEQLAGGAQKIFDEIDYSQIESDASNAWKTMGLSANDYLSMINTVGASFASTMGDQRGYETAVTGMQAISDYASGTGRSVEELNQKFALITRAASSYQSIADQFSGILPATSEAFLKQAQSAGFLSSSYEKLTQVPIAEYQQAVAQMLEKGVAALNLTGNTAAEAESTLTGSFGAMKASWENLVTSMSVGGSALDESLSTFVGTAQTFIENLIPIVARALESVAQVIQGIAPIIAEKLPELISTIAPMLLEAAVSIVNTLAESLPELIQSIMTTLTSLLPQITETIVSLLDTLAGTLLPMLLETLIVIVNTLADALPEILTSLMDALLGLLPQITETIITMFDTLIGTLLPVILTFGSELIKSIAEAIISNADHLANTFMSVLLTMIDVIGEILPSIINAGIAILTALAQAFSENTTLIVAGVVNILTVILTTIIEHLPDIIIAGLQIVSGLAMGIVQNLPQIANAIVQMIAEIPKVILENLGGILEAAMQIGLAIVAGILLAIPSLLVAIGRFLGIIKEAETEFGKSTDSITQNAATMQSSVGSSITSIEETLSNLSQNTSSTSASVSIAMESLGKEVKKVTVPVYDGMGNLISTFQTTQETSKRSTQSITDTSSDAVTKSTKSAETIVANSKRAETALQKLDSVVVSPTIETENVTKACNEIVLITEKTTNAFERVSNEAETMRLRIKATFNDLVAGAEIAVQKIEALAERTMRALEKIDAGAAYGLSSSTDQFLGRLDFSSFLEETDGAYNEFTRMTETQMDLVAQIVRIAQEAVSAAFYRMGDDALEAAQKIENASNRIQNAMRNAAESARTLGGISFGGGYATGGWMSAGTTYLVGELGPELITPTRSGYVHTAEETEDILGGQGGGITITIQGDVYDDEQSMRKKLKNAVLGVLQEQVAYG